MKYRIVNLQACDVYQVVDGQITDSTLSLKHTKDGEQKHSIWLYKAMFDDSMLNEKFATIVNRGDVVKKSEAIFGGKTVQYTNQIIQLNYDYNLKVETSEERYKRKKDKTSSKDLEDFFKKESEEDKDKREQLRCYTYKNGFNIDGIHYVRWMRAGGSSRVGKCLFINEKLLHRLNLTSDCGVDTKKSIDLASFEAYRSLMLSSMTGKITIDPKSILMIEDYKSEFKEKCVVVSETSRHQLSTNDKEIKVENKIWDGQSLIDSSLMDKQYGMLLLRNKFFKSCCFNCNIQQYFKDNNITTVTDMFGHDHPSKDIMLITTPSSVKYAKFGNKDWFEDWINMIDSTFGIVKHEKPTKHEKGTMVRTHYQLMNTLQLNLNKAKELLQPSLDRIEEVMTNPDAMKDYCSNYTDTDNISVQTKKDIMYHMLDINEDFSQTDFYSRLANKIKEEMRCDIKRGRILVNGNYSTLCGNPIEMLQQAVGSFDGTSIIGKGNIVSTRFEDKKQLLMCRSPHITMGNIYLPKNNLVEDVIKYMNLTDEIVCINSINENTLQRLQGADMDSDSALLTDNKILIETAGKNYNKFKVPYNAVESLSNKKAYTPENLAELDYNTSINLIGEIVNLSQILNSHYWDMRNTADAKYLRNVYKDICTLSVMSGIEIDKAKKTFTIDSGKELDKIRKKYSLQRPIFFKYIDSINSKKNKKKKIKNENYKTYNCTMDSIYNYVLNMQLTKASGTKSLVEVLPKGFATANANTEQVEAFEQAIIQRCLADTELVGLKSEELMKKKHMLDEDLFEAVKKAIGTKQVGVSTIKLVLKDIDNGLSDIDYLKDKKNALTEYFLLAIFNTKKKCAVKAIRK